jgi:endonuclease-3
MISISEKLDHIFQILSDINPSPNVELTYKTDFELLVSIILSAQSTDISVNKATEKLYRFSNTPEKIIDLGLENLLKYLSSLNLYRTKSKNVLETSKILFEKYNSIVPRNFDELIQLPGVGRKTANVFLSVFYGELRIGIDTHITRISQRLGISDTKNVLKIEKILEDNTSEKWKKYVNHWLVLHGRYICKAKKPLCETCKINNYCDYYISIKSKI